LPDSAREMRMASQLESSVMPLASAGPT
jgi:hypothetical protein